MQPIESAPRGELLMLSAEISDEGMVSQNCLAVRELSEDDDLMISYHELDGTPMQIRATHWMRVVPAEEPPGEKL